MAKLIDEQQDMAVETLNQLHTHGVVDDLTLLRIDLSYNAPGRLKARELADFTHLSGMTRSTLYAGIILAQGPVAGRAAVRRRHK